MSIHPLKSLIARVAGKLPLQTVLIVPFVVQIVGTVGLVGYLSYKNGQEAVSNIATKLQSEVNFRVAEQIKTYLEVPNLVNKSNVRAFRRGFWDFRDFSSQERQAWEQMQLSSWSPMTIIGFGTSLGGHRAVERLQDGTFVIRAAADGGGVYTTYGTEAQGNPTKIISTSKPFDSRTRPWYQVAVEARGSAWTAIYPHIYTGELLLALGEPIYEENTNKLLGVTYGLRSIEDISKFLRTLQISKSGQVFIVQQDGSLVAQSTKDKPYIKTSDIKNQKRLLATDSSNDLTRFTAKYLNSRFGNFYKIDSTQQFDFMLDGKRQFVQVLPFQDHRGQGIHWLIVVVIPEADVTEQIDANNRTTIILCIAALIGSITFGILAARWIIKPIVRLNNAAKNIAKGEWHKPLEIKRADQIGELAMSFNQMAGQLQQSKNILSDYNQTLEAQVAERTAAVQESERRLSTLLANLPGYVYRVANDRNYTPEFISAGVFSVTGYRQEEYLVERIISCGQKIHPADAEPVWEIVQKAIEAQQPYECEYRIITKSGTQKWVWERGIGIYAEDGELRFLEGFVTDISDKKLAEQETRLLLSTTQAISYAEDIKSALTDILCLICQYIGWDFAEAWIPNAEGTVLEYSPGWFKSENTLEEFQKASATFTFALGMGLPGRIWLSRQPEWLADISDSIDSIFYRMQIAINAGLRAGFGVPIVENNRVLAVLVFFKRSPSAQELRIVELVSAVAAQLSALIRRKQAEAALQESQRSYQTLTEASPICIFQTDTSGNCNYVNQRWSEVTGLSFEASLNLGWASILHPDDRDRVFAEWFQSVAARVMFNSEYRFLCLNGTIIWVICQALPEIANDGEVIGYIGTVTDISERKLVEQEIRQLSTALENAVEGISRLDTQGRYVAVNKAYASTVGYQPAEMIGMEWQPTVHPDERENMIAAYQEMLEVGKVEAQTRGIRKDGSIFYKQVVMTTAYDEQHNFIGHYCFMKDISDKKQAEETLQHQLTVIEAANDGIAILNENSEYIYLNKAHVTLFGYSDAQELIGKTWQELYYPEEISRFERDIFPILLQEGHWQGEATGKKQDGTTFAEEISLTLIEGKGLICVCQDITQRKQAELELRESEQRYLTIIEDQTELIARFLLDGTITFVNEAYCRYFGLTREEIIGQHYEPLIIEEDREKVNRLINSISFENPVVTIENRVIVAGEMRWTQWINRGIFDEQGELIKLQAVGRDITESKQIALALQSSEEQLNNILNGTNASIANFRLFPDRTWKYEYWSDGCEKMFGYTAQEFMAQPTLWFSNVFPEDVEQGRIVSDENFMSDFPTITKGEYRFFHKDGSLRWSSFQASSQPHPTSGWIVTVFDVDITEKKQAELALKEIAQREKAIATVIQRMRQTLDIETIFTATTEELRQAIKCDRVVVYQFNSDWSGQFVSESVADGWISLMQQKSNNPIINEQLLNAPSCTIKTTMLRGTPEPLIDSYMQETKGGAYSQGVSYRAIPDIYQSGFTQCYVELLETLQARAYIIVPIYCGSQLWGLLATYQNTNSRIWKESEINTVVQIGIQLGIALQQAQLLQETQQQAIQLEQAADAAAAANRAKSQFLANMSHELRTPLNGILGYAQILQIDKNCTPNQQQGIEIIHECGTHLLTLINDILDLSKIEAGKIELYPENVNLLSLLTNLAEIFQLKATQKSIIFNYVPLNQLPKVIHADEKRLRQVLMNLLSNAIKFTDQGSVTFKVEVVHDSNQSTINNQQITNNQQLTTNNQIRFQIEDTGIGIPLEQLEKIFLPFEQVGDISRRAQGTGLGLSITRKILELMGSQVFVESMPGVSSKFWFDLDLPVISTPINSTTVKSINNIIGYSGEKRKILIVDDRWENCTVLSNMLEPIGFELEQAANGKEGLEKAVEFLPDLILADLVMPVMDGYQMTQQLRQLLNQNIIIIAISANAFAVDRQKSLESGCNDFLAKPIQYQDLLDKIQSYLNLSWIYDHESEAKSENLEDESSFYSQVAPTEMVIPPQGELLAIYKAAQIGDIDTVETKAMQLKQLNPDYTTFATRILNLADNFDSEEIEKLVERYII